MLDCDIVARLRRFLFGESTSGEYAQLSEPVYRQCSVVEQWMLHCGLPVFFTVFCFSGLFLFIRML